MRGSSDKHFARSLRIAATNISLKKVTPIIKLLNPKTHFVSFSVRNFNQMQQRIMTEAYKNNARTVQIHLSLIRISRIYYSCQSKLLGKSREEVTEKNGLITGKQNEMRVPCSFCILLHNWVSIHNQCPRPYIPQCGKLLYANHQLHQPRLCLLQLIP